MTVETLGTYAGIVLSLALAYIPGVREWYEPKDGPTKAKIFGALLAAVALGIFGLSCAGVLDTVVCTAAGAKEAVVVLVNALISSQATFLLAVKPFKS